MFNELLAIVEKVKNIQDEKDYNAALVEIKKLLHLNESGFITFQNQITK